MVIRLPMMKITVKAEIVTKLGDEQADSRLLFNFGDLGGDLVIVIEGIQLSFPYQLGIFHLGASPTSLSF